MIVANISACQTTEATFKGRMMTSSSDDFFRKQREDSDRLYRTLQASPRVEITGLIGDMGSTVVWLAGQEQSTLKVSLDSWRAEAGPLQTRELTLYRRDREAVLNQLQRPLKPRLIVRVHARLADANFSGEHAALLERVIETDVADSELQHRREINQIPVTLKVPGIGTLEFDRRLKVFMGTIKYAKARPLLILFSSDERESLRIASLAKPVFENPKAWVAQATSVAARDLLSVKNQYWLDADEGEKPLTAAAFMKNLKLDGISIHPDGEISFGFEDGEMFGSHTVEVRGTIARGWVDASLEG